MPDSKKEIVKSRINDFKRISNWTVEAHNLAHAFDPSWLQGEVKTIRENSTKPAIIVVTHYAPCTEQTSRPEYTNNPWSSAFATDIISSPSTAWPNVKVWVYGHTHFSNDFKMNGIRVVGNQRGYVFQPDEIYGRESEGFEMEKIVTL
jgi:hypothetical protein